MNYGMAEGRQASAYFNVFTYIKYNGELTSVFGESLKEYYLHYNSYGQYEGRIAIEGTPVPDEHNPSDYVAIFDITFYKLAYPEIASALGDNDKVIFKHFMDYGMAEGRQCSENFNVWVYINYNSDLASVLGNNYKEYYLHFNSYGQYEGRTAR